MKIKTIILPGYSPHNKDWANEIKKSMNLDYEVLIHEWGHWTQGGGLSLKYELKRIQEEVGRDKFNIIAKSVGTYVAAKLTPQLQNQIDKIILCGIPSTSDKRKEIYKKAYELFPSEKIVCLQNTNDPFASYQDIKKFIGSINPKIKIVEMPRNDHHYPYPNEFEKFLK